MTEPTVTVIPKPFNSTIPWSYIGSVSSVSPISSFNVTTTTKTLSRKNLKSLDDFYSNGTGYFIEEEDESMLGDIKTVFIACLATLTPLLVCLLIAFGIRLLWIQHKSKNQQVEIDGGIITDTQSETANKPLHSHLLNDKISPETSPVSLNDEKIEICDEVSSGSNRPSNSGNGSIITMTLKNNHLIVETEERTDIEEDCRETTMKYSPSTNDGVFIVEVQQGMRRSPSSPAAAAATVPLTEMDSLNDQRALVHNPPPEKFHEEEVKEDGENEKEKKDELVQEEEINKKDEDTSLNLSTQVPSTNSSRTGLSTSVTSLSSLHQSYCYTTQQCYDHGNYGYDTYHGFINEKTAIRKMPDNNNTKPRITSAVYKNDSKSMSFDIPNTSGGRFMELKQNNSFDNVLDNNREFEEFPTNHLYKSKIILENEIASGSTHSNSKDE